MGNICLSDDHRSRRHGVRNGAEQLDKAMGLFQMDTGGSRDLPHKPDRIQTDITRPFHEVMEQNVNHGNQHLRRGEIEIDLVIAECGPQMTNAAIIKRKRRQQR